MAKKNLVWAIDQGFLFGLTPKTKQVKYIYDLYCDLGTPEEVRKESEAHNKSHNIYTYLYKSMEDIGLASVAIRNAQPMNLLQDWYYKYITCSIEECDFSIGDENLLKAIAEYEKTL